MKKIVFEKISQIMLNKNDPSNDHFFKSNKIFNGKNYEVNKVFNFLEYFEKNKFRKNMLFLRNEMNNWNFNKIDIDMIININQMKIIKGIFDEEDEYLLKDRGLLESAINNPYSVGYYESEVEKISSTFYGIIKNHPFTNGNKRTALFSILMHIIITIKKNIEEEFYDELEEKIYKEISKLNNLKQNKIIENFDKEINKNKEKAKNDALKIIEDFIQEEFINLFKYILIKRWEVFYEFTLFVAESKSNDVEKIRKTIEIFIFLLIDWLLVKAKLIKNEIKERRKNLFHKNIVLNLLAYFDINED